MKNIILGIIFLATGIFSLIMILDYFGIIKGKKKCGCNGGSTAQTGIEDTEEVAMA